MTNRAMISKTCRLAKDDLKMLAAPWTDPVTVGGSVSFAMRCISLRAVSRVVVC